MGTTEKVIIPTKSFDTSKNFDTDTSKPPETSIPTKKFGVTKPTVNPHFNISSTSVLKSRFKYKGNKANKYHVANPHEQEKNKHVMDQLLPLVSRKIDDNGGVARVHDLAEDRQIRVLIQQIPFKLPRSLNLILTQFKEFFVSMPNGLVGTALGFDTGMIKEDGTLEPCYASVFVDNTGNPVGATNPYMSNRVLKVVDLTEKADRLWKCALDLDNDNDLKLAYKGVEEARKHIRGENAVAPKQWVDGAVPWSGLPPPNPKKVKVRKKKKGPKVAVAAVPVNLKLTEQERVLRKEKILYRIVEILQRCPNQTKNMCLLVSDPSIKELKKGAISKFLAFLQEFPTMFRIVNVEGTPQYNVTLMDRHVPIIKANGRHVTTSIDVVRNLNLTY